MIRRLIILLLIVGCDDDDAPMEHTHDGVCVMYNSSDIQDEVVISNEEWRCFKYIYDEWNCLSREGYINAEGYLYEDLDGSLFESVSWFNTTCEEICEDVESWQGHPNVTCTIIEFETGEEYYEWLTNNP